MKSILWCAAALACGVAGCGAADPVDSEGAAPEASGEALVAADVPPSPADVYIQDITANGVGCPTADSVSTLISTDRTSFLVIFRDMVLENPPGPVVKNINCVAGVKLHVPQGWQFSIATITTRGYGYLAQSIRARETSSYFFAGNPLAAYAHSTLIGPYDDYYDFTDRVGFTSLVWSPCGTDAVFAINTSLNLNASSNPNGTAIFNTETVDGAFRKVMQWQWRQCH